MCLKFSIPHHTVIMDRLTAEQRLCQASNGINGHTREVQHAARGSMGKGLSNTVMLVAQGKVQQCHRTLDSNN